MSEWQPIVSAPKDGTSVLVGWLETYGLDEEWVCVSAWFEDGIADLRWYSWADEEVEPTHWMPLPTPPNQD